MSAKKDITTRIIDKYLGVNTSEANLAKDAALEIETLRKRIASLLKACETKDEALREVEDLISESIGVYGLHHNGDVSPWDELIEGGRFERLTNLSNALSIHPDF